MLYTVAVEGRQTQLANADTRTSMKDPTERFSDRVENYVKYRPGYPEAIISLLESECGLLPGSAVADIGCGTGNLARLFLAHGNPVFGVEPNRAMREAGQRQLAGYPGFTSVAGTAEATTLPDGCAHFVTAGQAFHWFDAARARDEFRRILKPGGWLVLVWNERQTESSPFMQAYEQLMQTYAIDYREVNHKRFGQPEIEALVGTKLSRATFDHAQDLDFQSLRGRILSSSYAPLAGHPNHEPMLDAIAREFAAHQVGGAVTFRYRTEVYYCQPGTR